MSVLGSIIALGAALAFVAVAVLLIWGGYLALRDEVRRSFIITRPGPAARALDLLLIVGPLLGAALLSLLGAGKIALVALGL
jgi:hypothetical protein